MRPSYLLAASLTTALLMTGCGREPTGQTVAVVNGEEITLGEVNAEISAANVPPSADKDAVRQQILQNIVSRRLLAQKAHNDGVDKSPEYLTKQRQLDEQLLISLSSKRQADTARLPDQAAIDRFIAENPSMFQQREILSLQQIAFTRPTGPDALKQLQGDQTMDQLIATLQGLKVPFQRGATKVDTATLPPGMMKQLNALPATEPFIVPAGGQMIASVIVGREPVATNGDESRKIAVQAIRKQNATKALEDQLKQLRGEAKIEYQPGYAPPAGKAGAANPKA